MPAIPNSHNQTLPQTNEQQHSKAQTQALAQVIAVSSGKGGVGKSTLTSNLGIALSRAGKKVCLFDADTNLANINILLGITPLHTLEHFFKQNRDLRDVIIKGPEGMDIIAGASGITEFVHLSRNQRQKLITGLRSLEARYEFLLIDTAAGIDETNLNILLAAPYTILTITHEPTSLTDAFSLLRVLRRHKFNHSVLVIVNMAKNHQSAMNTFNRFKETVSKYLHFKVFFAGHILADKNMAEAIMHQQAILLRHPQSSSSQCLMQIGERLLKAFRDRPSSRHFLSDHLTEVMQEQEQEEVLEIEAQEFIPPINTPEPESVETAEISTAVEPAAQLDTDDYQNTKKSALLKASYFARRAAAKK